MALFNIEKFVDKINSKKKLQSTIFSIKQLYALPSRFLHSPYLARHCSLHDARVSGLSDPLLLAPYHRANG